MAKKKKDWTYQGQVVKSIDDVPKDAIGFIYMVKNISNGRFYIGRKSFFSIRNTKIAKSTYDRLKAEGKKVSKTRDRKKSKASLPVWIYKKTDKKETPWKTYTGSSKELNADLSRGDDYNKEIMMYCYSKKEISYRELEQIVCSKCLERDDCYNGNVLGKWFPNDLIN